MPASAHRTAKDPSVNDLAAQCTLQAAQLLQQALMLMGVVCGYLGAAPAIVWASGVVFVAAFWILIPVAIWIYALIFAFSSLWFAHFCLAALQRMREEEPALPEAPIIPYAPDAPQGSGTAPVPPTPQEKTT